MPVEEHVDGNILEFHIKMLDAHAWKTTNSLPILEADT